MQLLTQSAQVGAILAARRKSLKLSQAQVAARLGLSQNRLSELETKSGSMTVAQMLALGGILGLEIRIGEASPG